MVNRPRDPPKADPAQIEQVLMNFCLNLPAARPRGGRLRREMEMADIDDCYCRFYPHVTLGRYAVPSVGHRRWQAGRS